MSAIQFAVGTFILSTLSFTLEDLSLNLPASYILIVLYRGVCASATASTPWIFLIKEEEAVVVSASSFIVPMVALFLGRLFLQEAIELESILGLILILTEHT